MTISRFVCSKAPGDTGVDLGIVGRDLGKTLRQYFQLWL
jgi:hypothetical protein